MGAAPGIGLSLGFEVAPFTLLDFRYTYYDTFSRNNGGSEVEVDVSPFEVGLLFQSDPEESLQMSGGMGLGYYSFDAEVLSNGLVTGNPDIDSEVGFYGLLGLEYTLARDVTSIQATRVTLFFEALYSSVEATRINSSGLGPTRVVSDGDFSGLAGNLGVRLRW